MFCNQGQEGGRGYFQVINSLADTHENPGLRCFMSLREAASDLSEKA